MTRKDHAERHAGKRLAGEMARFLAAGVSAVGTDCGTYYLLLRWWSHTPAKAASFIAGSGVAYLINKFWTFGRHERSGSEAARFAALYLCTLGANTLVNKLVLTLFPRLTFFAFLCATGTSTVLNYAWMKFWVFAGERR